jgi:hypothetical protein
MALLPTYTATGKVTTLFAPTFTSAPTAAVGSGWNNSADTALAYVSVSRLDLRSNPDCFAAPLLGAHIQSKLHFASLIMSDSMAVFSYFSAWDAVTAAVPAAPCPG